MACFYKTISSMKETGFFWVSVHAKVFLVKYKHAEWCLLLYNSFLVSVAPLKLI